MNIDGFKDGAIYDEITKWVQDNYGFHVSNLNIAKVKQKHGIIEREKHNTKIFKPHKIHIFESYC